MPASLEALNGCVGKDISSICTTGFASTAQNHCAHFVSHALGLRLGTLCGDMKFESRKTGASIRCDELYNALARRGPWADLKSPENGLLVFVLSARNMTGGRMHNVPQKHVGIYFGGSIYNYSNSQGRVVADPSIDAFHAKFKRAYAGRDVSLYYGVAP